MAIFRSFLLGDVRKSVANLTMYAADKGASIVRGKRMKIRNPKTLKQQEQRAKLLFLVREAQVFSPALELGFSKRRMGISPSNAFVRSNMNAVTVDEQMAVTVDYDKLVFSDGSLVPPRVSGTLNVEAGEIVFHQTGSKRFSLAMMSTDMFYAVVFETGVKEVDVVELKSRKESDDTIYTMDDSWSAENVKAYVFAISKDGGKASKTKMVAL